MATLASAALVVFDGPPVSGPGGTGADRGRVGTVLLDLSGRQLWVCTAAEASSGTNTAGSPAVPASIVWEPLTIAAA